MNEQNAFLIDFHSRHAGATSAAFGNGRTSDGRSSYDLLIAQCSDGPGVVVDIGCGDGHLLELLHHARPRATLIGIDFSAQEIALARVRPALANITLLVEDARIIPAPDGSISTVLSHLAFMLMSDIEEVIGEIRRVLKPGCTFSTIVGGGPRANHDAFEVFLEELLPVARDTGATIPRMGDRRTRSADGIIELLCPATGFTDIQLDDFYVHLDGTADEIWHKLHTVYESAVLSAAQMNEVQRKFKLRIHELWGQGPIPCTMAVRRVTATASGATGRTGDAG